MNTTSSAETELTPRAEIDRRKNVRPILAMLAFDVVGPLAVYYGLKAFNFSNVSALILSGILPAVRVISGLLWLRKVDAIGLLVLIGIAVGSIVGLISHNAKLVLLEDIVPTAVFGVVCLGSLATPRPMMFRFAVTFMGPETMKGKEFASLWRYDGFRHVFRVITVVWGIAFIVEAGVKALIIETVSISMAKAVMQVLPFAVLGLLIMWNIGYGMRRKAEGERLMAEEAGRDEPYSPSSALVAAPMPNP